MTSVERWRICPCLEASSFRASSVKEQALGLVGTKAMQFVPSMLA